MHNDEAFFSGRGHWAERATADSFFKYTSGEGGPEKKKMFFFKFFFFSVPPPLYDMFFNLFNFLICSLKIENWAGLVSLLVAKSIPLGGGGEFFFPPPVPGLYLVSHHSIPLM